MFIQAKEMNWHASAKFLGIQRQCSRQALALPTGLALYAEVPVPDWAAFHHQDLVTGAHRTPRELSERNPILFLLPCNHMM